MPHGRFMGSVERLKESQTASGKHEVSGTFQLIPGDFRGYREVRVVPGFPKTIVDVRSLQGEFQGGFIGSHGVSGRTLGCLRRVSEVLRGF